MNRTKQLTAAAILMLLYSAIDLVSNMPNLARGAATGPDEAPFAMTIFSFVLGLSGVFAAYGLWQNMKWGKVLTIIINALSILYSLVPLLVAPPPMQVLATIGIIWSIVILTLVLWRAPRPALAA